MNQMFAVHVRFKYSTFFSKNVYRLTSHVLQFEPVQTGSEVNKHKICGKVRTDQASLMLHGDRTRPLFTRKTDRSRQEHI